MRILIGIENSDWNCMRILIGIMHDLDLFHSRQILSGAEQWVDALVKAESLLEIE